MTEPDVYLRAAKRVDCDDAEGLSSYSCDAIWRVDRARMRFVDKYARVMAPSRRGWRGLGLWPALQRLDIPERNDLRLWLLAMMAACCEDFE